MKIVKMLLRRLIGFLYALTPRGRYERRVLTHPDVQAAFEETYRDIENWRQSFEPISGGTNWPKES